MTLLLLKHSKTVCLYQSDKINEHLRSENFLLSKQNFCLNCIWGQPPTKLISGKEQKLFSVFTVFRPAEWREFGAFVELQGKPYVVDQMKSIKLKDIYEDLESQIKAVKVCTKIFRIYENVNK